MVMRVLTLMLLIAASTLSGCKKNTVESYVPEQSMARKALETALDAWKANRKSDEAMSIPEGPNLQVLDIDWREGKKLQNFEIVNELPGSENEPKKFTVKLTYEGEEPKETIYHVVGINPLMVFRDEDYQKTSGM